MTNNTEREIISPVQTHFTGPQAEISIIARRLREESFGALPMREYIERARAIVLAQAAEAARKEAA